MTQFWSIYWQPIWRGCNIALVGTLLCKTWTKIKVLWGKGIKLNVSKSLQKSNKEWIKLPNIAHLISMYKEKKHNERTNEILWLFIRKICQFEGTYLTMYYEHKNSNKRDKTSMFISDKRSNSQTFQRTETTNKPMLAKIQDEHI